MNCLICIDRRSLLKIREKWCPYILNKNYWNDNNENGYVYLGSFWPCPSKWDEINICFCYMFSYHLYVMYVYYECYVWHVLFVNIMHFLLFVYWTTTSLSSARHLRNFPNLPDQQTSFMAISGFIPRVWGSLQVTWDNWNRLSVQSMNLES